MTLHFCFYYATIAADSAIELDLRRFVEKLTDKPITVVITHFHPDHAGVWETVSDGVLSPPEMNAFERMIAQGKFPF